MSLESRVRGEDWPPLLEQTIGAALEDAAALTEEEEELDPFELLPQAARTTDARIAGMTIFRVGRIGTPRATLRTRSGAWMARHWA